MPDVSLPPATPASHRPIRWWPAGVVLLGLTGALAAIRLWPDLSHQQQNLYTAQSCVLSFILLALWGLLFSRARWKVRLVALGMGVLTVLTLASLFRIKGVSGDLLPILEFKFNRKQEVQFARDQRPPNSVTSHTVPAVAGPIGTNDYPQFLGPHRNSTVDGPRLTADWTTNAPRVLWRQSVGPAWSGFAVVGSRAVTQEQRGDEETVVCYEAHSGLTLWTHADPIHYHTTIAGEGPRATPTLTSDRVYAMGATGRLNCLDLQTGRLIWSKDVPNEYQASVREWGVSCSPLVTGALVVVTSGAGGGQSLVAYAADNGNPVWTGGTDPGSYSSPLATELLGKAQVLSFNSTSIAAHDLTNGAVLWTHPWPTGHPHIAVPLVLGPDHVLVSSGYGIGTELLQVQGGRMEPWKVRRLWKSNRLKSKFSNLVHWQGYIYGLDDGILACLEASTGQLRWKDGRYGHGQLILSGALLILMAESGEVVLLDPNPEKQRELSRLRALRGKTWNPPALAGSLLLVRNDQEAVCYQLPLAPVQP